MKIFDFLSNVFWKYFQSVLLISNMSEVLNLNESIRFFRIIKPDSGYLTLI
jgi:hypothetical protein